MNSVLWPHFMFYPEWIFIQVGWFSLHHLNRHDSERPDIHFGAVSLSSHHLRCHPVGCSHHCAALILLWSDLGTEAKISCRGRQREGDFIILICIRFQRLKDTVFSLHFSISKLSGF